MKKTKKKLGLNRTTVQTLSAAETKDVHGGVIFTGSCPSDRCVTSLCPRHSVLDSCYNTDCCLEVP